MTRDEAIRVLQRFGEGMAPHRDMFAVSPTHDAPWASSFPCHGWSARTDVDGWAKHAAHHRECAAALGLPVPEPAVGIGPSHAEQSTEVMVAIARIVP